MNLKPGSLGESQVEWQQNNDWTSQIHRTALTSKGRQKSQASSRCKVCIHLPVASILLIRPATRVSRSCPTNLPSTMSWTCRFFLKKFSKVSMLKTRSFEFEIVTYLYAKHPEPTTPNQSSWSFTLVFFHPNRIPESHQPASTEQMHDGTSVLCHEKSQ